MHISPASRHPSPRTDIEAQHPAPAAEPTIATDAGRGRDMVALQIDGAASRHRITTLQRADVTLPLAAAQQAVLRLPGPAPSRQSLDREKWLAEKLGGVGMACAALSLLGWSAMVFLHSPMIGAALPLSSLPMVFTLMAVVPVAGLLAFAASGVLKHRQKTAGFARWILAWHAALKLPTTRRDWHQQDARAAATLGPWLVQLQGAAERMSGNPAAMQSLLHALRDLLQTMDTHELTRKKICDFVERVVHGGHIDAVCALNNMHMIPLLHSAEKGELSVADLFELGRGLRHLEKLAHQLAGRGPGVVYHASLMLRERLDLPVGDVPCGGEAALPLVDRNRASDFADEILAAESASDPARDLENTNAQLSALENGQPLTNPADPAEFLAHPVAAYLARNFSPWADMVARDHADEVRHINARTIDYLDVLEDAPGSEQNYLEQCNRLKTLREYALPYRLALAEAVRAQAAAAAPAEAR